MDQKSIQVIKIEVVPDSVLVFLSLNIEETSSYLLSTNELKK